MGLLASNFCGKLQIQGQSKKSGEGAKNQLFGIPTQFRHFLPILSPQNSKNLPLFVENSRFRGSQRNFGEGAKNQLFGIPTQFRHFLPILSPQNSKNLHFYGVLEPQEPRNPVIYGVWARNPANTQSKTTPPPPSPPGPPTID